MDALPFETLVYIVRNAPCASLVCHRLNAAVQEAYRPELMEWARWRASLGRSGFHPERARWAFNWAIVYVRDYTSVRKLGFTDIPIVFAWAYICISKSVSRGDLWRAAGTPVPDDIRVLWSRTRMVVTVGKDPHKAYVSGLTTFFKLAHYMRIGDSWDVAAIHSLARNQTTNVIGASFSSLSSDDNETLKFHSKKSLAGLDPEIDPSGVMGRRDMLARRLSATADLIDWVGESLTDTAYDDGEVDTDAVRYESPTDQPTLGRRILTDGSGLAMDFHGTHNDIYWAPENRLRCTCAICMG